MVFLVFFYVYTMQSKLLKLLTLITFLPFTLIAQDHKIRVAMASSLLPAMKEVKEAFESQHDIHIELIPGASGTLTNQILYGAPFDIFISANNVYSSLLQRKGLLEKEPSNWISGELVLWSKKEIQESTPLNKKKQVSNLLLSKTTQTIAIAQPNLAPYGDAAKDYLINLEVFDQIATKLIYGNNISIANQYIYTNNADVVITSLTSQIALSEKVSGFWYSIDSDTDLSHSLCLFEKPTWEANLFYEFLLNKQSLVILSSFGYKSL